MSKKIPFNVKFRPQIESGEYKVETRDGRSARIICWDKKNVNYPIAALVTKDDHEYFYDYTRKGELHVSEEGIYDLFIVTPEPEMSEFEKRLQEVLFEHATTNSSAEEKAHQYSSELLSLAKQQLLQSGELMTQEHHEKLMETQYEETLDGVKKNWHDYFTPQAVTDIYNAGRNDVLKNLPRWRIWRNGVCGNSEGYPIALASCAGGFRFVSVLGTTGEKYIMLDDLRKLPGFNNKDHE